METVNFKRCEMKGSKIMFKKKSQRIIAGVVAVVLIVSMVVTGVVSMILYAVA